METTNNIPETVKIDARDLLRIFASNIGAVCTHKKENFAPRKLIAVGGWDDEPYMRIRMMGSSHIGNELLKHCEWLLNLKPLGEISEEDALEVSKMTIDGSRQTASVEDGKNYIKDGEQNPMVWYTPEVVDYLRSKGYAVGYGPYSVDQLVEAGVYKIIQKENGK